MRILIALMTLFTVLAPLQARAQATDECRSSFPNYVDINRLPFEQVAPVLGCRQMVSGDWVLAKVGDTRNFRRDGALSTNDMEIIANVREIALTEMKKMMDDPRITAIFTYDVDHHTLTTPGSPTRYLVGELLAEVPFWTADLRDQYETALASYLLDPNNTALREYVTWFGKRRDAVLLGLSGGAVANTDGIFLKRYQYGRAPWPWQLDDPYTIDSYLIYLAGTMPTNPTSMPTST